MRHESRWSHLADRERRAFSCTALEQVLESRRQIIGPQPDKLIGDAKAAHAALLAGEVPTPTQQAALERAIRLQRPAPCCVPDRPTPLDAGGPFDEAWAKFQPTLLRLQGSVARLDRIDGTNALGEIRQPLGTGFLVAPNLLLTARHVVEAMSYDTLRLEVGQAVADFGKYHDSIVGEVCPITSIVAVHPRLDLGLLRVDLGDLQLQPMPPAPRTLETGAAICVIGYPVSDERSGLINVPFIFNNRFNVKRAAVGEILRSDPYFFYHDASTLGGNSGSPLIDLDSGEVCGVHVSGRALARNVVVRGDSALDFVEPYLHYDGPQPGDHGPTAWAGSGGAETADDADLDDVDDEEARPEDYRDRKGYDEDFLGVTVPLPRLTRHLDDVVKFKDDGKVYGVLHYQHFSVVMSESLRMCRFSACNIDGATSKKRQRKGWRYDPRISKSLQIMKECYGSEPKFSRGHMTRREDPVWGSDEKASTGNVDSMHVTNSVPQIQPFNAGIWLQLESYALDHTREDDMRICVFTGPFFDRDDPMRYGVPIPLKFWKVLAFLHSDTGKLTATGYTMSQEPFLGESEFVFGQHQNRQRPVHAIERQAGLSFGPLAEVDPMRDVPESVDRLLTAPSQIKFR